MKDELIIAETNNDELKDIYDDENDFIDMLNAKKTQYSKITNEVGDLPSTFIGYIGSLIYNHYEDSIIAYAQQSVFEKRLCLELFRQLPYLVVKYNAMKYLSQLDLDKMLQTSKASSNTTEVGINGSTMMQKSASTPTGVSATPVSTSQELTLTEDAQTGKVTMTSPTGDFVDKYTNFQGKTSGVRKSDIDRTNVITRQGSYKDLIDLYNKIPNGFYDEVLSISGKHFIFVY